MRIPVFNFPRNSRGSLGFIAFLLIAVAIFPISSLAQTAEEHAVKATFISRFVGFVQWPDSGVSNNLDEPKPFVVAVLGWNPFRDDLKRAFRGLNPGGRPVKIQSVASVEDLSDADLLIIPAQEKGQLAKAVQWANHRGVLTVGDGPGFAEAGVIINFYLRDDKVRFEINKSAADRRGFRISSLLLKVAKIVNEK